MVWLVRRKFLKLRANGRWQGLPWGVVSFLSLVLYKQSLTAYFVECPRGSLGEGLWDFFKFSFDPQSLYVMASGFTGLPVHAAEIAPSSDLSCLTHPEG